jgi:hypothetical protein
MDPRSRSGETEHGEVIRLSGMLFRKILHTGQRSKHSNSRGDVAPKAPSGRRGDRVWRTAPVRRRAAGSTTSPPGRDQRGPEFLRSLLEVREAVSGSSADSLFDLLDRAAALLWSEPDPPSALGPPLPVVLSAISTAGHYFGRKWTVASWRAGADCGGASRIANGLAGLHGGFRGRRDGRA